MAWTILSIELLGATSMFLLLRKQIVRDYSIHVWEICWHKTILRSLFWFVPGKIWFKREQHGEN